MWFDDRMHALGVSYLLHLSILLFCSVHRVLNVDLVLKHKACIVNYRDCFLALFHDIMVYERYS